MDGVTRNLGDGLQRAAREGRSRLTWTKNKGRPRTKDDPADTAVRLLEPCSFRGVAREPGDIVTLTKTQAAGLICCRRAQLETDEPPCDLALRRSKAPFQTVRYLVSCCLPGNGYVLRTEGHVETVNYQRAMEMVQSGVAELALDAPAAASPSRRK